MVGATRGATGHFLPGNAEGKDSGGGRPSSYNPSHCERVVELMEQGFSLTGVAGKLRVSRRVITDWQQAHPEFREAVEIGKAARAAAYEEKAWNVAGGEGGPGAASMIQFALKNLAPDEYSDTQTHRHTGANGGPIQTVDLTNISDDHLAALEAVFGPLAATGSDDGRDPDGEGPAGE